MEESLKEKEFRIWGIWTLIIIIAWGIAVGMFYNNHKKSELIFLDTELERFQGEIDSTLITYEEFSNYIFDEINQDEEVLWIMHQANSASDSEKKVLREQLYDKFSEKYPSMQKYKFRQLHFHLPTTESFLRVHLPQKYGDLLFDSRESVRLVNESKTKISGFEEGKIFNGFRNVYPLAYKGEHVGSVEISMSSASVIEILSRLHKTKDFYFVIDKSVVQATLFKEELSNYRDSEIIENYCVDIEVDDITSQHNVLKPQDKKRFFQNIKNKHKEKLKEKQSFSVVSKFEGTDYTVKFLAINNFKQAPIAYLISVSESVGYREFLGVMYKEIMLVTLLALFVIAFGLLLAVYQHKLKNSADIDYLTNIYNRNKFYEIASREMKVAKRNGQHICIMLMDIDLFKNINDSYGHERGDRVLKELTNKISGNIREIDVFARWGGEEFVLLLPNTGKTEGLLVAEKIRSLIDESQAKELKGVTISIGVSLVALEEDDVDLAINRADEAMYQAKRRGRNQVCFEVSNYSET